jgi:hypothetical protein
MVAASSTLSQPDQDLLTAFIGLRFNLLALAEHTGHPLLTLQDWALEPHIQTQIARYRSLEKLQHEIETADARSAGIATLFDLLHTSQDPIERRRAAQTLIRVGTPQPTKYAAQPIRKGSTATPRARDSSDRESSIDLRTNPDTDEDLDSSLNQDLAHEARDDAALHSNPAPHSSSIPPALIINTLHSTSPTLNGSAHQHDP